MDFAPLQFSEPNSTMAFRVLILHWILTLVWGLALNDTGGGFYYCRLVMPGPVLSFSEIGHEPMPWIFTFCGCVLLCVLGIVDKYRFNRSSRLAFYPLPLFVMTQILLMGLNFSSTRH